MRFETTSRPIRDLVRDFNTGAVLLPQFQRDYVWKSNKIRNLLDSLLRGFPVGGFYLWRPTSGTIDAKRKGLGSNREIQALFSGYLIDGQQRLTSLEAAYGFFTGEDKDGSMLRCFLDLAAVDEPEARVSRIFVTYGGNRSVARRVEDGDSSLVPVSLLFEGHDPELRREIEAGLKLIPGWDSAKVLTAITRFDNAAKMLDQQVPCTTISDVSDEKAVEIFSRLNKGGVSLRQGDVRAAELARGKAVDVLRHMREFVSEERPRQLGFSFSFAFRSLVMFHRETSQFSSLKPDWMEMAGPHGRSLMQSWEAAEFALKRALEFVDEEMGWSRRALLPSNNAVIALAVAIDRHRDPASHDAARNFRRWLCLTTMRGVFQGSVETTLNRFQRAVRDGTTDTAKSLVESLKRDERRRIAAEELNAYAQPWGPTTQVLYAWLTSLKATDWMTGDRLDTLTRGGNPSLPGGDVTLHHIFPRKLLTELGFDPDEANCPANYALLSRSTNSELGDRPPSEVAQSLSPTQKAAAAVQFFGEAAGDRLKKERYEEFCEWRADRLAEALNEWLGFND